MEQVIQITTLCVVGALLALVVRRGTPELALLLAVACTVTVLLFLAEPVEELLDFLRELGEYSGVTQSLFTPLYKTIGIAFVVKLGGEQEPSARCWWLCRCCRPSYPWYWS